MQNLKHLRYKHEQEANEIKSELSTNDQMNVEEITNLDNIDLNKESSPATAFEGLLSLEDKVDQAKKSIEKKELKGYSAYICRDENGDLIVDTCIEGEFDAVDLESMITKLQDLQFELTKWAEDDEYQRTHSEEYLEDRKNEQKHGEGF